MVALPIKMSIFNAILGLVILIELSNLCETVNYEDTRRFPDYEFKKKRPGLIDVFNDEGFVQIRVPGKSYAIRGNQIFVEGSYGGLNPQFPASTQINIQTIHSSGNISERTKSETVWNALATSVDTLNFWKDLNKLSLEASRLHNLSSATFKWLSDTSVQLLNMRYTDIEGVAEDTLEPMQRTLKVLDLACAIISLPDLEALMQGLCSNTKEGNSSTLIVLSLANLGLHRVPYKALTPVQYSLRALSMFGNDFRTVPKSMAGNNSWIDEDEEEEEDEFASEVESPTSYFSNLFETTSNASMGSAWATFPKMPFLTDLDLRQCNINSIERGSFKNLRNLRTLYISENNILILRHLAFEGLANLVTLDLSFNRNEGEKFKFRGLSLRSHSFAGLDSLQTINLSNTFLHPNTVGYLSRLPQSLTTLNIRQSRLSRLEGGIFRDLSNLQILDISNNIGLAGTIATTSFEGLTMLQELHMAKISIESLEPLQELSSLKILNVKRNQIDRFDGILAKFPLLEHLDISYNYITSWKYERAFENNPKLQGVYLNSNSLSLMSEEMVEDFKSLSYLTLAHNHFVCNCQLKDFMKYLIAMNNNSIENLPLLIDYQLNSSGYVCTEPILAINVGFEDTDHFCIEDSTPYWLSTLQHAVYISTLVFVCSVSMGGLIYWKWWYIRYVAVLIKNATVLSMINVENCEDRLYLYDIFVSYSNQNRNWVIEELLPNIEGPETRFNICLHERDFQVGVGILENIIMGMDQSRTILLVISNHFLRSQWCQFEMHLAQHRLLETCREELVLVLLEEIPRRKRPKILHYLMMVKTYILWPKDSSDGAAKKLFWKRLRRAITVNKSKHTSVV